jgi:spore germination protein YaaH
MNEGERVIEMTAQEMLAARLSATPSQSTNRDALQDALIASMQAAEDLRARIADLDANRPYAPVASPSRTNAFYHVQAGDTLASIASKLDMQPDMLYKMNSGIIEQAARDAGHPGGSDGGVVLAPDLYLEYRPFVGNTRDPNAPSNWF